MASSLVTSITSTLMVINRNSNLHEVKIGLMNLKALLLCLRMFGIDVDVNVADNERWLRILKDRVLCSTTLHPDVRRSGLFSRIRDAIRRINVEKVQDLRQLCRSSRRDPYDRLSRIAREVHWLANEVHDDLLKHHSSSSSSSPPKVDKIDPILDNALDFLAFARYIVIVKELGFGDQPKLQEEAMGALEVQITFLKHFLVFAIRTGVEHKPLRNVLIHIQPFVINVVRVFMRDTGDFGYAKWINDVQSKSSTAAAIEPRVYQAYARALSTSTFSSTRSKYGPALHMEGDDMFDTLKNFLDSLIAVFWDVLRRSDIRKDQVKLLYERLRFSSAILKQRPITFDRIGGVICDAAIMLISSLHQTDVEMSNLGLSDLLQRLDVIRVDAQTSPTHISQLSSPKPKESGSDSTCLNISHGNEKDPQLQKEAASSSHQSLHSNSQVVGFQNDEVTSVVDRLTRGSKQLRIVPIIGMAGLGKTTFALKIYNHPSVKYHFHIQAWCPISQVLDKRRVLLSLYNQTKPGSHTSNMTQDDLADELRKSLKGKRYLIFLDDVWTLEVWNSLTEAFPDDSTNSRVVLTSRHHHIAPYGSIANGEPYLLRLREVKECLEILQAKLFPLKLNEHGITFAEKCKGLPLTAVIVAGLLATTEEKHWKQMLYSLSSGSLYGEEQCKSALELSFKHLPDDLKFCFLYFGAFPEDEEITVKRLILLWMAEGFVQKRESERMENVAREYLDKLVERSLVTVAKIRSIGGVKTCRIHDLLHEFCQTKAKQENFFHLLKQSLDEVSDFNEPCNLQRLSIHSDPLHFQKSRLYCPGAHSLLFFSYEQSMGKDYRIFHISYIIQIYKLLRVLDVGQIVLNFEIPYEIGLLTRLTYLSIQSYLAVIPYSIGDLSNLETFIADFLSYGHTSFPHSLWNLKKLKYLHIGCRKGFTLPSEDIENSSVLLELETLSGVVFCPDGSMERQMRKLPNIRRLSCSILPAVEGMEDLNMISVVPDSLCYLESLTITGKGKLRCEFGSTENLRKLKLKGFELSREDIAVIGGFPNLEVLKLEKTSYLGGVLEMEEGEFSILRYLKLYDYYSNLERWIASDEQLPYLQKLVLASCTRLKEVPSWLDTIPTLQEIESSGCSLTVESLVRGIEEVQRDWGNSIKAHIR